MGIARSLTQGLFKSRAFPAAAAALGVLRIDRVINASSRWVSRDQVRRMHPPEIHEAQRVFGNSISYQDVRVVEASPVAQRIAELSGHVHLEQDEKLAVTVFNTIHFSTELQPDIKDMPWMIHELTHVWQYFRMGSRYLGLALQAQALHGKKAYDISQGLDEGWTWDQFNLEQQGNVARAYYRAQLKGKDTEVFEPYVAVLKGAS